MANDYSEIKGQVKKFYMEGMEAPELVKFFSIPSSTLYSWITNEKWKEERNAVNQSISQAPEYFMMLFKELLTKLSDDRANISLKDFGKYSDMVAKFTKSYKTLFKERDAFSSALWVLKELSQFLSLYKSKKPLQKEFFDELDLVLAGFKQYLITGYSPKKVA